MADNRYMVWYGFYLGSMLEKSISNLGILLLAEVNKFLRKSHMQLKDEDGC